MSYWTLSIVMSYWCHAELCQHATINELLVWKHLTDQIGEEQDEGLEDYVCLFKGGNLPFLQRISVPSDLR